jgi:hypothetical protein
MTEPEDNILGGRVSLQQLIADRRFPYEDEKQAKRFLDRYLVPYVTIRRQRRYRPAAIDEALARDERQQIENATA